MRQTYISKIHFNWFYNESGGDYDVYEVGKGNVVKIVDCQHDFIVVHFENGDFEEIYNLNQVFHSGVKNG
jgi:hypothetical protein